MYYGREKLKMGIYIKYVYIYIYLYIIVYVIRLCLKYNNNKYNFFIRSWYISKLRIIKKKGNGEKMVGNQWYITIISLYY